MTVYFSRHSDKEKGAANREKTGGVKIVSTPSFLGIPQKKFRDIIDDLPVFLWVHDEDHIIVHANNRFKAKYSGGCMGRKCYQCIKSSDTVCNCCVSDDVLQNNSSKKCNSCIREGVLKNIHTFHQPIIKKNGTRYILKSSIEMEGLYNELRKFKEKRKVQTDNHFQHFWVMCSSCKKIKDNKSSWVDLEAFLVQYLNVVISHGICQGCIEKLYPEISNLP